MNDNNSANNMPTTATLCHSCRKYRNAVHFNTYKNIPNRRCKTCVLHAQMDRYENPGESQPYVIFLQMDRNSEEYKYLLPFFQEMHADGLVENPDAAPYIQLTEQFHTQNIESIFDRMFQMKEAELDDTNFMGNPGFSTHSFDEEYSVISVNFNAVKLRKFLKQLSLDFPFIIPLYKLELILFKTKNRELFSQFVLPENWRGKWEIVIWKTDGKGKILSEV